MPGELIKRHGKPEGVRFDNGPEFRADSPREWLEKQNIKCLNMEFFWSAEEAEVIVEDWRQRYHHDRPHSALGYRTPAEAARSPEDASTATKKKNPGHGKQRGAH